MNVKLANGIELTPIVVTGASRHVQGATRDVLSFVFPLSVDMMELDAVFTESACETITITADDGSEAVHKGYTIRAELKKAPVVVTHETTESEAVTEERITVSMAQRTYTETQLAALSALLEGEV